MTSRYSDISLSFQPHPISRDVPRATDAAAVAQSIRHLILTDKYERLLSPKIGSNVRALLFDQMDGLTASRIKDQIENTVTNYEPRAILRAVRVQADPDRNSYDITIEFSVVYADEVTNRINITLQRIR